MKPREKRIAPDKEHNVMEYVTAIVVMPCLTLFALYLLPDYFPLLFLTQAPDFISVSLLKANFVCSIPVLMATCWLFNQQLFFTHTATLTEKKVLRIILGLTLALLLVANTLIFTRHFTLFSPPNYVRCWEPMPFGTWHYAKTADICLQHGLSPIRFLSFPAE